MAISKESGWVLSAYCIPEHKVQYPQLLTWLWLQERHLFRMFCTCSAVELTGLLTQNVTLAQWTPDWLEPW